GVRDSPRDGSLKVLLFVHAVVDHVQVNERHGLERPLHEVTKLPLRLGRVSLNVISLKNLVAADSILEPVRERYQWTPIWGIVGGTDHDPRIGALHLVDPIHPT